MSKYTFVYEHNNVFNDSNVCKLTMESNVDSLQDVLEQFEMFLKGAGFQIDGRLDIVNEDEYPTFDDEEYEDNYYVDTEEDVMPEEDVSRVWPFPIKESEVK